MPFRNIGARSSFALQLVLHHHHHHVGGRLALLLLHLIFFLNFGLVQSTSPEYAAPSQLLQIYGRSASSTPGYIMQQAQPLYVEVEVKMPVASRDDELYRGAVQVTGDMSVDGLIQSRKLGRFQALHMNMGRCLGLQQWILRASTQDIKMGRSYRRLLVGRSLEEEQMLWFKCHPHQISYDVDDDDDDAGESNSKIIALIYNKLSYTGCQSRGHMVVGILQVFLISHPCFFLHLALAFLLLAFLASLLYFSLD